MRAPASDLIVRLATPDDAEGLSEMVGLLAEYERAADQNRCTPEVIRAELSSPDAVLKAAVALRGTTYVGMASWFTTFSTFAGARGLYIEDIYVKDDQRHKGIGTALLRFVAKVAVQQGCGRVEWTTLVWNTPAMEFYESLGARPNDAWTTYRLSDEWLRRQAERCRHETRA